MKRDFICRPSVLRQSVCAPLRHAHAVPVAAPGQGDRVAADDDVRQHTKDKDIVIDDAHLTPYRLNLANLGFKLYKEVYLCDTNSANDNNHVEWLRPTELKFHGYSPYIIGGEPVELNDKLPSTAIDIPSILNANGLAVINPS